MRSEVRLGPEVTILGPPVPVLPPDNFEAVWEIAARVQRRSFDPNDPVRIEVFLTGYGRCSSAKLAAYFPDGLFARRQNDTGREPPQFIGKVRSSVMQAVRRTAPEDAAPESPLVEVPMPKIQESRFDYPGMVMILNSGNFLDRFAAGETPGQFARRRSQEIGWTVGERKWSDVDQTGSEVAPVSIEATIAAEPTPGDHTIPLVLTYMTERKILLASSDDSPEFTGHFERRAMTSTFALNIHVSFFWEQDWFQSFVIGGTITGIILGAAAVILSVFHPFGY
jgi:hypothetical protein